MTAAATQYVLQRRTGKVTSYFKRNTSDGPRFTFNPALAARFDSATEAALEAAPLVVLAGFEFAPAPSQEAPSP